MRWAALDFETATRSGDSACALGVVIVEGGEERYRQSWLIRPPYNAYHWGNVRVHGISPEMTVDAPEFPAVWDEAMSMIGSLTMVAHNAPFDIGVIRGCCETYGIAPPPSRYLCTVQMSRRTWKHLPNHKLPTVAGHVGAELVHHDALSDAAACSAILRACIDEAEANSVDGLLEHHSIRERRVHAV